MSSRERRRTLSKKAFLFPGQGAQKIGMGQSFYEADADARAVFEEASEILGYDMKALCFEENEKLNLTQYTQPAMVTTGIAILKVVEKHGLTPDTAAGLSLGEYEALYAAGARRRMQFAWLRGAANSWKRRFRPVSAPWRRCSVRRRR